MREGPEHVGKGGHWVYYRPLDASRDTSPMVCFLLFSGPYMRPVGYNIKADFTMLDVTGQRISKRNFVTNPQRRDGEKPKGDIDSKESTMGFPKGSNTYGNGGLILGDNNAQVIIQGVQPNISPLNNPESTLMKAGVTPDGELIKKYQIKNGKNIYRQVYDKNTILGAYFRIKSHPGNMTPGTDGKTLDGITQKKLDKLSQTIKDQSFKFGPVRRVYIPKANGKERPLGVPNPRDKIVQESMRHILEQVYEPIFEDSSHGFRPGKSCHTALKQISG